MEKRRLGKTDIDVSLICLGTMTWGEQNTEADGHAQLNHAVASGINFVDTAEMYPVPPRAETYGQTEEIIGSWLEKTGRRSDIILATKVVGPGPRFPYIRPHMASANSGPRLTRQSVIEACEASLKRLKTDYIDLYQIHWPDRVVNVFGQLRYRHMDHKDTIAIDETLAALGELQQAGKVRHIGVSNETAWGVMHYLQLAETKGLPRVQSIQNPYSLLNRSFEINLSEVAQRENVGLLAYSPLAFGVLSGKYLGGGQPAGARLTLHPMMDRYSQDHATHATSQYVHLAQEHGVDAASMALAFVNQQPFVTSTIIGATSLAQLDTAIASADIRLSKELNRAINQIENAHPFPAP